MWNALRRFSIVLAAGALFGVASVSNHAGARSPKQAADKKGPCLVLTCDGGGARGLLTALVVQKLDQDVGFLGRVQVFAGTSTGGIIALGLADEQKIGDLVALYQKKGEKIFQPYDPDGGLTLIGAIQFGLKAAAVRYPKVKFLADSTRDFFYVKYDNQGLKEELETLLDCDKKGRTLAMLKKKALVTTLQLQSTAGWKPRMLHNLPIPSSCPETGVVEAAMCTCAAPLFFPPFKHATLGFCADGGLFANSPGAATLGSLVQAGYPLESIRMLSIGTGAAVNHFEVGKLPFLDAREHGVGAWLSPIARGDNDAIPPVPLIAAIFDATSAADAMVCEQLLTPERYQRAQVKLTEALPLDARSEEEVQKMEEMAREYFKSKAYADVKAWVQKRFVR